MSGRTSGAGRAGAVALAAVMLVVTVAALLTLSPKASAAPLVPGSDFTISTTITSSPTSADHAALLYPGVTRYLWYTVHNPLPQAITVTSLGIAEVQAPTACPRTNLDLDELGLTGAFIVPSGANATVLAPRPISLLNLPDNQDACKGVTFTFTFTGTGWYSDGSNPQDPPRSPEPARPRLTGQGRHRDSAQRRAQPGSRGPARSRSPPKSRAPRVPSTGTGTAGASAIPTGTVSFYLRAPSGALDPPGHDPG